MTWNPHKDKEYQAALRRVEKNRLRNSTWVREAREFMMRPFSRRRFLLGATAIVGTLACTAAFANTPFTTFQYPITGGVANRNTPDRMADVFNVMEFGTSVGTGGDDRIAIQACFNTAFGMSQFTGSITTGGVLTVTNFTGTPLTVGAGIVGISISNARRATINTVFPVIGSFSSGSGGNGTYNLIDLNNSNAPLAIDTAITTQPMGSNRRGGQTFNNKIVWFPAARYRVSSPVYLMGVMGGKIYGAGANNSEIQYTGNGTEGNWISTDSPAACPIIMTDGVAYFSFDGIDLTGDPQTIPMSMTMVTSSSTTAGTRVLNFSQGTANGGVVSDGSSGTPQLGMGAFNLTDPTNNSIGPTASGVASVASTSVTLIDNVGSNGVASGARIVFTTPIMGLYQYQSAYSGTSTAWTLSDVNFGDFSIGFLGGASAGNCENNMFFNCGFTRCTLSGMRTVNGNTVNWGVYGGGCGNCGHASTYDPARVASGGSNLGAGYSVPAGTISVIYNISCTGNNWDVIGAGGMSVISGSGEGAGIAPWVTTFSSASISGSILTATVATGNLVPGSLITGPGISGYVWVVSGTGPWTLNHSVGTPTGPFVSPGIFVNQSIAAVGSSVTVQEFEFRAGGDPVTGSSAGLPELCRSFDCTSSGMINAYGCVWGPPSATTIGYLVALGDNGAFYSDGTQIANASSVCGIKGNSNSRVWLKAMVMGAAPPINANLFANFSGKVMEFSPLWTAVPLSDFTVANLPTASAIWDRCRLTVTDYSVAWGSGVGAVGTSVTGHGGGSHVVPVICPDGAGWVVSG